MRYTIKNDKLTVTADTAGAELKSIQSADGTEYLWQSDPAVWRGQAPNLFPYIARLTEGKHIYKGKEYEMKIHGLIKYAELRAEEVKADSMTFRLDSNEDTKAQYPFDFVYRITYRLDGDTLLITNTVENKGEERMFFGLGGHPGFRVPLDEGLEFTDYAIEFSEECHPTKVGFTSSCFLNGEDKVYELEDHKRLPLRHDLFDNDAVVLKNASKTLTICSPKGSRGVEVSIPDFPLVGFWHMPKTEAPYVCVEPWSSLPSRQDIVEDLSKQSDMIRLDPGKTYENHWKVRIY